MSVSQSCLAVAVRKSRTCHHGSFLVAGMIVLMPYPVPSVAALSLDDFSMLWEISPVGVAGG